MAKSSKTFFLAPVGTDAPMASLGLGLARALERTGVKIGYIKPVQQMTTSCKTSASPHFARSLFRLDSPEPFTADQLKEAVLSGDISVLLEEIVAQVEALRKKYDVILVEGLLPDHGSSVDTISVNCQLARGLAADYILVGSSPEEGKEDTFAEELTVTRAQYNAFGKETVLGLIMGTLSELASGKRTNQRSLFEKILPIFTFAPQNANFDAPLMQDLTQLLHADTISKGQAEQRRVRNLILANGDPDKTKTALQQGDLVILSASHGKMLELVAAAAGNGLKLAGIVICEAASGTLPSSAALQAACDNGLPVYSTPCSLLDIAAQLRSGKAYLSQNDQERAEMLIELIADNTNTSFLIEKIREDKETVLTPPAFRHYLTEKARAANKRIVLPEGDEPRTLRAAAICQERKLAQCVLVGDPAKIKDAAKAEGITLPPDLEIVDQKKALDQYIAPMVEMRKSKGLTPEDAAKQLEDSVVLGTMMLAVGDVDGLVSGAVHTTASTVRPALQLIKTSAGNSIVSSVFFMLMNDQVMAYADCAINPNPTAEQLAEIAWQTADSVKPFGINPRVAMLSYSTGTSGIGPDVDRVREATEIVRAKRPDIMIEGPIQYDAATVLSVGKQKAPNSPVAGQANVFIFPDLGSGNITYKAVQRSADLLSVGPMLQGLRKPVNDLSRGALVDDIVYTIALTAIQAAS